MLKLEAITKNALISGIEHGQVVRIFSSDLMGDDDISEVYKANDGRQILESARRTMGDLIARLESRSEELRAIRRTTLTVTRNEILYGLTQANKFILAIVVADGEQHEGPFYIRNPFKQELDWAVSSINMDLQALLEHANLPERNASHAD